MWEAVTVGTAEKKVTSLQLGQSLNDAMLAIERANAPKFDGILTSKIDFNKTDELPRDKLVTSRITFPAASSTVPMCRMTSSATLTNI